MFEARDGRRVPYFNMFVFSPVSTHSSDDYQASGFKAEAWMPASGKASTLVTR